MSHIVKKCYKCKEVKNLSEFHKGDRMADGHINKCKPCCKLYNIANRERKRLYNSQPRIKKAIRKYKKTDAGKISAKKSMAKYINSRKAYRKVENAIKYGKLIRPDACEKCGLKCKPDSHHDDYLKPLDVIFLCKTCHADWHLEFTPINR